jgi:hypothetical protein
MSAIEKIPKQFKAAPGACDRRGGAAPSTSVIDA